MTASDIIAIATAMPIFQGKLLVQGISATRTARDVIYSCMLAA